MSDNLPKGGLQEPGCPTASFHDDRIDMAHWWPTLSETSIPTPETYELPLERREEGPPEWDTDRAVEIVTDLGGEAFARSGYKSAALTGGGQIRSTDPDAVDHTLTELLSQHVMMQMRIGKSLWLRELLPVNFCGYARDPLHPECRVFIRDGDVACHHPRLEGFDAAPGGSEMREEAVECIDRAWDDELRGYAQEAASAFDGWWSIDFIMDWNGNWYCSDMAVDALYSTEERGDDDPEWRNISEHADDCENNLQENHNDE